MSLAIFWLCATAAFGQTHSRPLDLGQTRYSIRAGEAVEVDASGETLDFLLGAQSRTANIKGLVVGPNHTRNRIVLRASLRTKPGEYTTTISATGANGEVRETALDVVVSPMLTVPSGSSRPPVILLNGWETGFTGTCPVSADSTATFGNLAQYLLNDGVPQVFFFDNCAEDPNQPVEVLGNDLASVMNSIKYNNGTQVPQIDLVAFSLGGLIARSYLCGLQTNGTYLPPSSTFVRKMVLIATPNFGSFIAANYGTGLVAGTQDGELVPGSSFLWNLATWNQYSDDLRGVDTIAVAGNAGAYISTLNSSTVIQNATDGIVSETSAALGFVSQPVESSSTSTRVVPYCHVDPSAYLNSSFGSYLCNAAGIANVTTTGHLTGQIVRSFLSGTTAWSSIGTSPGSDPYLSKNGGMYTALVTSGNAYAADVTSVSFGTITLAAGGDQGVIYYGDLISGTGVIVLNSNSIGAVNCGSLQLANGYTSTERCKISTDVYTVTPLVSGAGRTVTAGSTVTLTGIGFGSQCSNCKVQAQQVNSSTVQTLTVASWAATTISVKLPAGLTGLLILTVTASAGSNSIGIMAAASSTIAVTPASLTFNAAVGGSAPDAQSVNITNSGTGTLAWTASVNQSWLSLSATSGTAPSTPTVSVNPAGMAAGNYTGAVQISANGASNSPLSIPVTLTVSAAPAGPTISAVVNAGGYQTSVAPATWVAIFGTNLSATTYGWQSSDFNNGALPTALQGVSVTIDGNPAYIGYVSPTQVNVLAPDDTANGPVQVQVTASGQASNSFTVQESPFSPALLTYDGTHVAAQHADYSVVNASSPAQSGETILVYGVGFGPTSPAQPTGQLPGPALPLANSAAFTIGGQTAQVQFAGLVGAGLYQFNVTVPSGVTGDSAIAATVSGLGTQTGTLLTVQ